MERKKDGLEGKGSGMEIKASSDSNEYIIDFTADVKQEKDGGKLHEATRQSAKDKLEKEACKRQVNESKDMKTCEMGQNKGKIREGKERLKEERDLEIDFLRKIEEEKERERERERAEMAAVERATAEFRQRALAEARERLEKASAEARERLIADKASDARLRAEHAAVQRATSEARVRTIEKAKAEKASSYEARDRVERPVTDKFFAYSRNGGFRQSSSSSVS